MKKTKLYLSEFFTLEEMTKSGNALRFGVPNIPDEAAIHALRMLCEDILEPVRKHFNQGFAPKSGYRSPQVNRLCNGSSKSQHMSGNAVDIEVPGVDNFVLAKWIEENLTIDQLVLECYTPGDPTSGWVHVSLLETANRHKVNTFDGDIWQNGLVE